MKRTPLRPGRATLRRTTALRRQAAPIKVRGRARFPKGVDREYRAWVRSLACLFVLDGGCWGETEACHVKSRGAGGADRGNLLPLCRRHHQEQHTIGVRSFAERHGADLPDMAGDLAEYYGRTRERLAEVGRPASR